MTESVKPYFETDDVQLFHGDMREVLPALDVEPDCVVTDPPYGMLCRPDRGVGLWDIWPSGWPTVAASASSSMWCFGSMRMFLDRRDEFAGWRVSHDIVWSKGAGTGRTTDRFRPSHEIAMHWYRGRWDTVYHDAPQTRVVGRAARRRASRNAPGILANTAIRTEWVDDGTRLALSVIQAPSLAGRGIHPTEKPIVVLDLLIRYACPPGGLVLDPFAGSGSTAVAARLAERRTMLIEAREDYCELIARRLSQDVLPLDEVSS